MRLVTGDLWSELGRANLVLVTTNAIVTRSGRLVMGRGAAREARDRFPGLDADLGAIILGSPSPYGVALARGDHHPVTRLGAFQVKHHWRHPAQLDLIAFSMERLAGITNRYGRIALNFPGIGNGGLRPEAVLPLLRGLPDHVFVYRRPL
jgi:hypothetical protein